MQTASRRIKKASPRIRGSKRLSRPLYPCSREETGHVVTLSHAAFRHEAFLRTSSYMHHVETCLKNCFQAGIQFGPTFHVMDHICKNHPFLTSNFGYIKYKFQLKSKGLWRWCTKEVKTWKRHLWNEDMKQST